MIVLLFKLLIGHALADFPLQSADMKAGKNRNRPTDPAKIPAGQKPTPVWPYELSAHALVHAGAVYVVTGLWYLAAAELVAHWMIDYAKCENWTNPHTDQALHVGCKVLWAVIAMLVTT